MSKNTPADSGSFKVRKRFGQHFLCDRYIIDQIIAQLAIAPGDHVIEIGPGQGALTWPLLDHLDAVGAASLTVIEIDRDLIAALQKRAAQRVSGTTKHAQGARSQAKFDVIAQDVLQLDLVQVMENVGAHSDKYLGANLADHLAEHSGAEQGKQARIKLVGNLPYNISSPILFHALQAIDHVDEQCFMLQKEVVDRITAEPDSPAYGRLSVMMGAYYHCEQRLDVPPESFMPPPRVQSAVVAMQPKPSHERPSVSPDELSPWVALAFSQRRKVLRHTLGRFIDEAHAESLGFSLRQRAETLSVEQFVRLAAWAKKNLSLPPTTMQAEI